MEINAIIRKNNQLSKDLENAFNKEINNLLNYITSEYDLFAKNCNTKLSKEEVIADIKKTYYKMNDTMCTAITKSGDRCSRKIYNETRYCKIHVNNSYFNKNPRETEEISFAEVVYKEKRINSKIENMEYKFIDDEFYYIDDKFIYDKGYSKCGYINNNSDETNKYIFTSDPFILEEFE